MKTKTFDFAVINEYNFKKTCTKYFGKFFCAARNIVFYLIFFGSVDALRLTCLVYTVGKANDEISAAQ